MKTSQIPSNPKLFEGRNMGYDDTPPWGNETEITLRDLFAACALVRIENTATEGGLGPAAYAAYQMADAMLRERGRL